MNWVLVIAGLIPLWAALFIVFTNMRVLKDDAVISEISPKPITKQAEKTLEDMIIEEEPPMEKVQEKKSILSGLFGKNKQSNTPELIPEAEIDFTEPHSQDINESHTLNRGLRRLWGVSLVLVFLACLAYGCDIALAYVFKEYRWVIGTTNPWTRQLDIASIVSATAAALMLMISTLKTGIHLIRG